MKYIYEIFDISDDYIFGRKDKPTKCQQFQSLEDQGWEIFAINKLCHDPGWQVIARKPR